MTSIIMLLLLLIVIIIFVVIFRKSTTLGFSVIGIVFLIGYFANMNQTTKEYYDNGQLKSEMKFKSDNLISGKFYHKNGQLSLEGDYQEETMNGLWKQYYEDGKLEAILMFKNDLFYDKIRRLYKNGQVKEFGYWVCDINRTYSYRSGVHTWWYENGDIKSERDYDSGYEKTQICFDNKGSEIECETVFLVYNKEEGLTNKIPVELNRRIIQKSMEDINLTPPPTLSNKMLNLKKIIPNKK